MKGFQLFIGVSLTLFDLAIVPNRFNSSEPILFDMGGSYLDMKIPGSILNR